MPDGNQGDTNMPTPTPAVAATTFIGKVDTDNYLDIPIASTLYGTCATAASTQTKVVVCPEFDLSTPITGMSIKVKFTNTNTYNGTVKLNINSTGAKNAYKHGTTNIGNTANTSWAAGAVVTFTFDGTNWLMADHTDDTNTTYTASTSVTAVSTTASAGTASTYSRGDHTHNIVVATGDDNGQVKIAGQNISVKGLGSAAYTESTAYATAAQGTLASNAIPSSQKGAANGIAELDANGLVPSSQLPSYVDDVLEFASQSQFPATGETGKIYIAQDTNKTYRWSGTAYTEISASLALGETSSTAYRGDRGKTAYTHATDSNRLTTAKTSGLYKIAVTAEGHIASVTAATKEDIEALGIAGGDTTYTISTGSVGSASLGTSISVDDITNWATGTLPALTITPVNVGTGIDLTHGSGASATVSGGTLTLNNGDSNPLISASLTKSEIGSASNWSAGTLPALSYSSKNVPNVSVESVTVVTAVTKDN